MKTLESRPDKLHEVLLSARQAFELFDRQTGLLESSFHCLEQDLQKSSGELDRVNHTLYSKVEELQRVLSRLHSVLESLTDGVLVVDHEGMIEFSNSAACRILGDYASWERKRYDEVITVSLQKERLDRVIRTARPDLYKEFELNNPSAGRVLLQSSMSPVKNETGDVLGVVEIIRDITRLRQMERQLKHQHHMAALGEMAAGIAHEIRNPLGAIEGFALLLKKDLERSGLDAFTRLAGRIVEGTENLNYVVTNLLEYARPLQLRYEMFAVHPLLCSLRDCLTGLVRERKVELVINDPGPEMQMLGDIRQLRHVLINLGRNAVEACGPGGKVTVEFYLYQNEVAFHISDNGSGISPADQERIFDPFFTTKPSGTGLGLSFCHKIVGAHGGEMLVHSDGSTGTAFQVIIPLWRNKT